MQVVDFSFFIPGCCSTVNSTSSIDMPEYLRGLIGTVGSRVGWGTLQPENSPRRDDRHDIVWGSSVSRGMWEESKVNICIRACPDVQSSGHVLTLPTSTLEIIYQRP